MTDLGLFVAVVPWRRGGQVMINDRCLSSDNYKRVWRWGSHRLLQHVGAWGGAVVEV